MNNQHRYRRTEFFLLFFSAVVVCVGFIAVSLNIRQPVDIAIKNSLLIAAIFFGIHVAIRLFAPKADPYLLPACNILSGFGVLFIWRLKPMLGMTQFIWVFIGAIAAISSLAFFRNYEKLKEYKYIWAITGIILLFAPIFVGVQRGGSKLWISFGLFSFQPAEIAKIVFVFFFAAYLMEKQELLSISTKKILGIWIAQPKHLGPLIAMWLISLVILILERDLGTSLLFFGLFLSMIYVATGRSFYVLIGILLFLMGATACYFVFSHVQTRVDIWLNPWVDPNGKGYQILQSLYAIASGRLTGTGLGLGYPTMIPEVQTDFIFSAIAEELGLLGGVAITLVYLLVVARGIRIALAAKDKFGKMVALGLSCVFALQSFTIIAGVTKLVPLTGVTLPFMSYGGSSILMNFILLSILLSISSKENIKQGEIDG